MPSSSISPWLMRATSLCRCAVSRSILTNDPYVPVSSSTGQMVRISSSDRMRVRARSFGLAVAHTSYDGGRDVELVVSVGVPVECLAHIGAGPIGHDRTGFVFDPVQHFCHMRAAKFINANFSNPWFHKPIKRTFNFIGAP